MITDEKLRLLTARSKEGRALPKSIPMLERELLETRKDMRLILAEYGKLKKFVTDEQRTQVLIS